MRKILFAAIIVICASSLSFGAAPTSRFAGKSFTFTMTIPTGMSSSSLTKMMSTAAQVLFSQTGIKLTINLITYKLGDEEDSFQKLHKSFQAGKSDFALVVSPMHYAKYKDQAEKLMIPFYTVAFENKPTTTVCAYVRNDSPIKSAADMKGRNWGGARTLLTRHLLLTNGVNASSMKEFFKSLVYLDDTNITGTMNAIITGKIDVYVGPSFVVHMAKKLDKKYNDIREFGCVEFEHNWFMVHKKGVDKELLDEINRTMPNIQKNKNYSQFNFLLAAVQAQFVPFNPANLKNTFKVAENAKKFGWEKEQKDFVNSVK